MRPRSRGSTDLRPICVDKALPRYCMHAGVCCSSCCHVGARRCPSLHAFVLHCTFSDERVCLSVRMTHDYHTFRLYCIFTPPPIGGADRDERVMYISVRVCVYDHTVASVVKVRGARGGSAPLLRLGPPLLESEPSLPTAGPKLLNSTKNHNVRCRINKF